MNKDKEQFGKVLKSYTIWFTVFAFFSVIIFFIIGRKSMYNIVDGVYQQFSYFVYTGKWIRMLFNNIFVKHVFELPMWDMSIGMGSDPTIVFSSVANPLADPFYWLSAFIPNKASEYAFDLIIILKLYASGLAFSYFAFSRKHPVRSIVAGAMTYTFSMVVFTGFSQASFLNIFYLFPLLMAGADRVWERRGFKLYVISLALCFINSYYFTYMMMLFLIFYCIVRFCIEQELHRVKTFLTLIARFTVFSLTGIGIGLGLQLPAIINLAGIDRLGIKWEAELFSWETMKNFFINAFSMTYVGREGPWGVSPIVLAALIVLFLAGKSRLGEKLLFVIFTVALFLPVTGSLFNGLSFPTGRYVFGYIFLLAYITVSSFDHIFDLSKRTLLILTGISILYLVLGALTDINGLLSGVSLLIFTVALLLISESGRPLEFKQRILMIPVLITCVIIGYAHLHVYLMDTEIDAGYTYEHMFQSNGLNQLSEEERAELNHTRYDLVPYYIDDVPLNSSMLNNVYGYDYYNTNYNNGVDRYYIDMAINSNPLGFMMNGLRGRNYLELLNGTSMISIDRGRDGVLCPPYSYELIKSDGEHSVYEATRGASLVFFYDEAVPASSLDGLNPIEAEELMMNYCVTDEGSATPSNTSEHTEVDYEITETSQITMTSDDTFHTPTGGYMILSFDDISDSEISLYIEGITGEQYYVISAGLGYDGDYFVFDTIEGQSNVDNMYYHWRDAFVVNYGFVEPSVNSIRLVFLEGDYSLQNIKVYSRSREQLDSTVNAFYDHADLDNIGYVVDGNRVHASITNDEDRYLYFAIPYSEGWNAYIDGEPVRISRANTGFMSIPVTAGEHNVELRYFTPHLVTGLIVTFTSLTAFALEVILDKKKAHAISA